MPHYDLFITDTEFLVIKIQATKKSMIPFKFLGALLLGLFGGALAMTAIQDSERDGRAKKRATWITKRNELISQDYELYVIFRFFRTDTFKYLSFKKKRIIINMDKKKLTLKTNKEDVEHIKQILGMY